MKHLKSLSLSIMLLVLFSCSKQLEVPVEKISTDSKVLNSNNGVVQALATPANKVVIGYIPGWANVTNVTNAIDFSIVTHVNLAFFAPSSSGAMMSGGQPLYSDFNASEINYVVAKAHAEGRKVLASLGGGSPDPNAGDIAVQFRTAHRTNFIDNLAAFVTYFNLDGIDIDVEGTTLATIKSEQNYAPFVSALRNKINPLGKLVTAATAGYVNAMIPASSYSYLDLINIMSYDNGWNGTGNHSTYDAAIQHIQNFLNLGCPASKLVLGVPFYGYKPTVGTGYKAYKDLLAQYGTGMAYVDYYDGYKYNGITAIEAKTKYAAQYIRGVMIWELSQDVTGTYSLLQAVGRKINTPAP
ncbi:glycosyl hydrolase family 18 protein [Pedobacter xixiisoli]|uniref:chitinase n=1 Tax=Pedobacter xixiisoli TaxID=1476464 RepID=A0A285ZS97_9SPHI|nr:glycosyl hydrolase family 18 protein [Pedobacter xixiisoli]SOD12497.1 Chitinase, GH18 family [Pedobacter xixiisoli]